MYDNDFFARYLFVQYFLHFMCEIILSVISIKRVHKNYRIYIICNVYIYINNSQYKINYPWFFTIVIIILILLLSEYIE